MNTRKITQVVAVIIICVAISTMFLHAATYEGYVPPDIDSPGYTSETAFNSSSIGQCTWFVWGRTYEKLGISLSRNYYGDAKTWWTNRGHEGGSVPKDDSIAVFHNEPYGHVVYVEHVEGNSLYFNEANWNGIGYKGKLEYMSISEFETRSGKGNFSGYIYLKDNQTNSQIDSQADNTVEKEVEPTETNKLDKEVEPEDTTKSNDIIEDESQEDEKNNSSHYDLYEMKRFYNDRNYYSN
ncbi:MAG: CHAP domain-containing protein [Clostridiales bacterium]